MITHEYKLGIFVLLFAGMVLLPCPVDAQAQQAQDDPRNFFEVGLGGGWGKYSMYEVNKHFVDGIAKPMGFLDDHVDDGPGISAEAGFFLTRNVSIVLGVTYIESSIEKHFRTDKFDNDGNFLYTYRANYLFRTELIAPELKIRGHGRIKGLDGTVGVGVMRGSAKSLLRFWEKGAGAPYVQDDRKTGRGLGYDVSAGLAREVMWGVSLGVETGYRHCVTGDMKNENGRIWEVEVDGELEHINLDFSGPYVLARVSWRR